MMQSLGDRQARGAACRLVATCTLVLISCSDAPLFRNTEVEVEVFDNTLKVNGQVCTSDPSDLVFPLKVMFIIDVSQSMDINDPVDPSIIDATQATQRSRAMRDVITQFIDLQLQYSQTRDASGNLVTSNPAYCNTGIDGCSTGNTGCAACGANAVCVGPDCCRAPPCGGLPACPAPSLVNGTCLPLCDVARPGCGPGESDCADCPTPGDRCLNGVCGKNLDPNVEFSIVRFGQAKDVLTSTPNGEEGFTSDAQELVAALPRVNFGGSVTDYEGALSNAFTVLSRDMQAMRDSNATAVNRSKYVVIMLTDGQPDPRVNEQDDWANVPNNVIRDLLGELAGPGQDPNTIVDQITNYNVPTRILRRVQEIIGLKSLYGIGDITFHTAFLAGQSPAWAQDVASSLLKQMADVGGGTFRSFPNGEALNFLHVDFSSLRRVFRLKSMIVSNVNGRPYAGLTISDSDGDGLDDGQEERVGSSASRLDTDSDGFSDTLEYFFRASGWDPLDPGDADCSLAGNDTDGDGKLDDTDGDGLFDCEERFLGTNRRLFDTDADGIPDNIEVRFGTNPVVIDVDNDLDFDGMPNGDEIRLHTDPRADDAAHRSRASYRYDVQRIGTGIEILGMACTDNTECPTGANCTEGYCRCFSDDDCSSQVSCTIDDDCTRPGEFCDVDRCRGPFTCAVAAELGGAEDERSCVQQKNITCYSYEVENISLVTPKADNTPGAQDGWNNVFLYFGEVPFDNPNDFGNFNVACVRARYLEQNGAKQPASGVLTLPQEAWKSPVAIDPETDCVCPDGRIGSCTAP